MHCPSCGGSDVRESHSHGIGDGVLEMFGFVAYRCRACRHRFHRRPPTGPELEFEEAEEPHEPQAASEPRSDVDSPR